MKKVSELTGGDLDLWVANIEGVKVELRPHGWAIRYPFDPEGPANEFSSCHEWMWVKYSPSGNWDYGGPIIEREKISLIERGDHWVADMRGTHPISGKTPLIAAMRAYVSSVYGECVGD